MGEQRHEPIPAPSPECLAEMQRQGVTEAQREQMILGVLNTEWLSGFTMPLDIAVAAFESALFGPLPKIGEHDVD